MLINFSYTVTLKLVVPDCFLNGSFTYAWFCNIMHWSSGNIGTLTYAEFPDIDTFHCTVLKIKSVQ